MSTTSLMSKVAEHFAGAPVKVHLTELEGCNGLSRRNKQGFLTIELQQNRTQRETLKTFLHEVGHCKLHNLVSETAQVSGSPDKKQAEVYSAIREAQAEAVAYSLLRFAEQNRDKENYEYITGCLLSLLHY
jgi:hypothetical protein